MQVYNWGTFHGLADFPVAEKGHLFVGSSGSGKSTVLDALAALTTPGSYRHFNAAAMGTERRGTDRNLVTYIRGAWARQTNSERESVQKFLRSDTTLTALAATYRNLQGKSVTLALVLWIRGSSTQQRDVRHQYMVLEREFDLLELKETFLAGNLEVRALKAALQDAFIREEFSAYQERFCRLLGIESERALRLLHKTQSTKDLGDINLFLRDFMLDPPETFDDADNLVRDFQELNDAHQQVVSARRQIETLKPARDLFDQRNSVQLELEEVNKLDEHLESYILELKAQELDKEIEHLFQEAQKASLAVQEAKAAEEHQETRWQQLQAQLQGQGGQLLDALARQIQDAKDRKGPLLERVSIAEQACRELGMRPPASAADFLALQREARAVVEDKTQFDGIEARRDPVLVERGKAAERLTKLEEEIESLQRNPSNIPRDYLRLRIVLAQDMGVQPEELPFAGELMEVRADESRWTGAIERVLRSFSLSFVVRPELYADFARALDERHTGMRVTYLRAQLAAETQRHSISEDSLVRKVEIASGPFNDFISQQLRSHFDYACAEDMMEFRRASRAVTIRGQVKHSATRHEKDDRRSVDDRVNWVMGLDNLGKLAEFQTQATSVRARVAALDNQLKAFRTEHANLDMRRRSADLLVKLSWPEIDINSLLLEIGRLEQSLALETQARPELANLQEQVKNQKKHYDAAVRDHQTKQGLVRDFLETRERRRVQLANLRVPKPCSQEVREKLRQRADRVEKVINLESLPTIQVKLTQGFSSERSKLQGEASELKADIERVFATYIRSWPAEAGGLDAKLDSAMDFFVKLETLELDGLPRVEDRFFTMLQKQSTEDLVALQHRLSDERKRIFDRLDQVNASLRTADYNPGTHLVIEATDRIGDEVRAFRDQLKEALSQAFSLDKEVAERRFAAISALVKRFSSQETVDKNWKTTVLDVRQQVEFQVREFDGEGEEREVYNSGAGKSGGQRQKLAAACLAAALRYQLGGQERSVPSYATVVLDEAFDKADPQFTAAAMTIFTNFGFQTIIATPMRSVMTLEPFVGGAAVVHIVDQKYSRFSQVQYDTIRGGLAFSDKERLLAQQEA
ncbi:ATP-binding protein [Hydrogenophaga borbori]